MSRYDDLRRMREAKFARQAKPAKAVTLYDLLSSYADVAKQAVANPPIDTVTKAISVTKSTDVTKPNKGGRPLLGDHPMTPAERMRRYRQRKAPR
jgi:hypothetical protein